MRICTCAVILAISLSSCVNLENCQEKYPNYFFPITDTTTRVIFIKDTLYTIKPIYLHDTVSFKELILLKDTVKITDTTKKVILRYYKASPTAIGIDCNKAPDTVRVPLYKYIEKIVYRNIDGGKGKGTGSNWFLNLGLMLILALPPAMFFYFLIRDWYFRNGYSKNKEDGKNVG